jgi:hypothetical protein
MFKKFLNLFSKKQMGTGANLDTRSQEEKDKDYYLGEIVASINPVDWIEKPKETWRKFPIFNQNGSGSCVANTMAKLLGILYWLRNGVYVHFSALHIYQRRANKPSGGMGGVDAFDIARKGVTLEVLAPSQSMTDVQMDSYKIDEYKERVGEVFSIPKYVQLPIKDIDAVASVIQTTQKGVMLWFYFKIDEWTEHPIVKNPNLTASDPSVGRHSVSGVDYTLINGKKAIIIDDSWGTSYGLAGQRIIDEDFFKTRNFFAAYPLNFVFEEPIQPEPVPGKPKYVFTQKLVFIPWDIANNGPIDSVLNEKQKKDVIALQDILKYEGFFPTNTVSTGYYGAITAKGVLGWQKKYAVASIEELDSLSGKLIGPKTIDKLNELFG